MVPLPYDEHTLFGALNAFFMMTFVIVFVSNLILSIVLACAARERGRSGILWFIFGVLFSGPIGALFLIAFGDAKIVGRVALK